jgi:hypothetical protein
VTPQSTPSIPWREASFVLAITLVGLVLAMLTPELIKGYSADQPYYIKSAFFPWIALSLVVIFGGWSLGQSLRRIERDLSDELDVEHTSVWRALGGAALLLVYVLLCAAVGFAAATFISVFLFAKLAALSLRTSLILAGSMTALLYSVFVIGFKVWFAPGWLIGLIS